MCLDDEPEENLNEVVEADFQKGIDTEIKKQKNLESSLLDTIPDAESPNVPDGVSEIK